MKIGIVTLVSDNYGNKYQNYAVEQLLSEYGEVVTYRVESRNHAASQEKRSFLLKLTPAGIAQSLSARLMNYYDITNARRSILGNLAYFLCNRKQIVAARTLRHEKFLSFQKKYLHISDREITAENCREEPWNHTHDFFVCGSDQIWNPNYGTTSELAFLSFAPERSIALAPSFGVSEVAEEKKAQFSAWISGVKKLSVREDAGQQIIKDLTGREAEVLLDPTMAIAPSCWETLARRPDVWLPKKYILTYFLGRMTDSYHHQICRISKETGLPVVNLFHIEQPEYYSFDPNEVLYAIRNADMVLTDSFHGTVFSILLRRNFLVFRRDEGGESMHSRLSTLLGKFGLENRLTGESGVIVPLEDEKWEQIEQILAAEREKTKNYLKTALDKE